MIRTLNFIDSINFINKKNNNINLVLDFDIDAGFSFTEGVIQKKFEKKKEPLIIDESIKIPKKIFEFDDFLLFNSVILNSVEIKPHPHDYSSITDRYSISANFTPCNIDYSYLEEQNKDKSNDIISVNVAEYLDKFSKKVKEEIVDFIELSSPFARVVNNSYNLYLIDDNNYYRILQNSGENTNSSQYPMHPHSIKGDKIKQRYFELLKIPQNIKNYLKNAERYRFLGFYDESFICYYKIIESIFKGNIFPRIISKELFSSDSEKLVSTLKNSNQKTMMLYIYQWINLKELEIDKSKKDNLIEKMILAGELRNNISHSSGKIEESRGMIDFIKFLSYLLISTIESNES